MSRDEIRNLFVSISRLLAVGLFGVWLTACSTASSTYPAAPAVVSTTGYNYIVGPGDTLNITVWRNPELSQTVPVRPDGKVSTPLVDELVAQGKTTVEIARDIEKALSKLVRDPVVTVIVTNFVGRTVSKSVLLGRLSLKPCLTSKK